MKKGISPVVATALLLVVAVVAVVGFNTWFNQYQSKTLSGIETQSQNSGSLEIEDLIGSTLYIKNPTSSNLSLKNIKIAGKSCSINQNFAKGISAINVSSCLNNSVGIVDVVLVTNTTVRSKKLYLPTLIIIPSSSLGSSCLSNTSQGFNGGLGSVSNRWRICNCTQLQKIKDYTGGNYTLMSDIDCSMTRTWNAGSGWISPVFFTGTINGGRHTISNLYQSVASNQIGFIQILFQGRLENINFNNMNITYTSGTLGASQGGLISSIGGGPSYVRNITVSNSQFTFRGSYVGGIFGDAQSTTITNVSIVSSKLTNLGNGETGGMAGRFESSSSVTKSLSSVKVTAPSAAYVGGFVGVITGGASVSKSLSLSNVTGDTNVGGFVAMAISSGTIMDNYAKSRVNGTMNVGGFIGNFQAGITLSNCYSASIVGINWQSGFMGASYGVESGDYWDSTIAGTVSNSGTAVSRTTAQMKQQSTFTGWDFTNVWTIINGTTYPTLR